MGEFKVIAHCKLCQWIQQAQAGTLNTLLYETKNVVVIAGDHQFYRGYCVVISKPHAREMHHLPKEVSAAIFQDVLDVGAAVESAFKPWKLNYASLGNVEEHLHWHVIPRYESDADKLENPWKNASRFGAAATTSEDIAELKNKLMALHPMR